MCRSGKRSALAAALLNQLGYPNIYTLIDGFDGVTAEDDPAKDLRTVNGWRNAGLPWAYPEHGLFFFDWLGNEKEKNPRECTHGGFRF